jgi:hypothetical protein
MDGQARELEALYETRYTSFRNARNSDREPRVGSGRRAGGVRSRPRPLPHNRLGVGVCLCGRVAPDGEILAGPVVLEGETTNGRADSLLLRFQDGERQSIPLVWVGEPVNTTFFLYGVPERHWQKGHLPTTLTLLAADGDELDTREISGITTKGSLSPR